MLAVLGDVYEWLTGAMLWSFYIVLLATLAFGAYKLIGLESASNAAQSVYSGFKKQGETLRDRFKSAGNSREHWCHVRLQPLKLVDWLCATCPDVWHKWLQKAMKKEVNEFLMRQSTKKTIPWKLLMTGLKAGSPMPAISCVEVEYHEKDANTMIITAGLRYWSLDGGPLLGLLFTCTGQYKGSVSEVKTCVDILKLEARVQIKISPHKEADTPDEPIQRYTYEIKTLGIKSFKTRSELQSGIFLDKEEENKLRGFLESSCAALVEEADFKLEPPHSESKRYSSGVTEEQGEKKLAFSRPLSRSSSSLHQQPVGGGMSLDILPKQLVVEVVEGHKLCRRAKDHSDSLCILEVDAPVQKPQQTTVVKKEASPEWNEAFVFDLCDESSSLTVSVYHHDVIRKNEFLGRSQISLSCLSDERAVTKTLFLEGRASDNDSDTTTGSVTVKMYRKSIPLLSKLKRRSTATAASASLRELKGRSVLSQSMDANAFRLAYSHSQSQSNGHITSPETDSPMGQGPMFLGTPAKASMPTSRANSPAITVESPSDNSDDDGRARRATRAMSEPAGNGGTSDISALAGDDQVDFAQHPGQASNVHSSPKLSAKSRSFDLAESLGDDMNQDLDRLSSTSGMSGMGGNFSTLVIETEEDPPRHLLIPAGTSKRSVPVRGQKLHIYNNHVFVASRLNRQDERCCVACGKDISGFGKQGYRCRDCGAVCHKKCHCFVEELCLNSTVHGMRLAYHWEIAL